MENTTNFTAPDIECEGCANAIKKAVGKVSGVTAVEVDVPAKQVTVRHTDPAIRETITQALDRAGFPPSE